MKRTLKLAAKRHDVIGMHVHDPAEAILPDAGILQIARSGIRYDDAR